MAEDLGRSSNAPTRNHADVSEYRDAAALLTTRTGVVPFASIYVS